MEFSDDGKAPDGNITDCSNLIEQFCDKMREGEAAGKGRVSTRILYDMFQMNFPSTSKGETSSSFTFTVILRSESLFFQVNY